MPSVATFASGAHDQETVVSSKPSHPGGGMRAPTLADDEVLAGRYRIVRFLARGGMGEVYEAEDLELRQHLALKTISAHAGDIDPSAVQRFKREIALARTVTHPNVCRIFDLGQHVPAAAPGELTHNPVTFLTMELLHGETLSAFLRRRGRLSTAEALPLVEQMAAALGAAHDAEIVHRDFKSENVFLVPQEAGAPSSDTPIHPAARKRVVVTDFGVARGGEGDRFAAQVTGAGIVGTPAYMAPEQVEGGAITPATDLYSLGIVIYEMVTGRLPFESENPLSTAVKRLKEAPPPPHVHVPDLEAWWERAILRCLERDPAKRFGSAAELLQALQPPQRPTAPVPLASSPEPAPSIAAAPTVVPHQAAAAASAPSNRRSLYLGLVLLVVSALSIGLYTFNRERDIDRSRITPRRSVAVLGFKNSSGQGDVAWLGTALSEMLTTELARGEALRTVPGDQVARVQRQIDPEAGLEGETLGKLRSLLGCDFLVSGSYVSVGASEDRELRLDLRLQDAALESQVASLSRTGREEELLRMVSELGAELRQQLGIDDSGHGDDPLAGLPEDPQAARLYSEALDLLRDARPRDARQRLEEAARTAPSNALVHLALSNAWEAEGYSDRAAESATRAFELSSPLPREDRLAVEGRYREATGDWVAAIDVYRDLWDYFPDDLEYGLRLAAVQVSNRDPSGAADTLTELRRLPAPISEDPRIDLAEASVAGLASDFQRQLETARQAADRAQPIEAHNLVAQARLSEAQAQRALGQLADAEEAARRSREIYDDLQHAIGSAQARTVLANVSFDRGDLEAAADLYRRVVDDYRALGVQDGTASGLRNLAMVQRRRGDLDGAQALYEEAAEIFESTGDELAMTHTLNNLGVLFVAREQLGEADAMFERSRKAWQTLGNRSGVAYSLNNLAAVAHLMGNLDKSREMHEQALAIRQETGEKIGEAISLTNLAKVLLDSAQLADAEKHLNRAVELSEEVGDRSAKAQALYGLGRLRLAQGSFTEARKAHSEALELRQQLEESHLETDSRIALARLALEASDPATAEADSRAAVLACRRQERFSEAARAGSIMAQALLTQNRLEESSRAVDEATELAASSEQPAVRFAVAIVAARQQAAEGKIAEALVNLRETEDASRATGLKVLALEAALAAAEAHLAAGRETEAHTKLQSIVSEASASGLDLLADKAAMSLRQ